MYFYVYRSDGAAQPLTLDTIQPWTIAFKF